MEDFNVKKLQLLQDIERLIKIIDKDIDWFIASFQEKDPKRRALTRFMSDEKQEESMKLAKEINERYR